MSGCAEVMRVDQAREAPNAVPTLVHSTFVTYYLIR